MSQGEIQESNKTFDIIALGDANIDLLLTGIDSIPQEGREVLAKERCILAGGSTATFACWSSRMGMKVAFIGKLGEDFWGKKAKKTLEKAGVNTKQIIFSSREKTGLTVCLSGKDRSFISHPGANATICREEIDSSSFSQARHLHLGGFFLLRSLQPAMEDIFQIAKKKYRMSISLDPGWDPREKWKDLLNLLHYIDVLILNEEELMALTKRVTLKESLQTLTGSCRWIVVKRGNRGALAWNGRKGIKEESFKVKIVDTTSSGDSFNAGLIYGWLRGLSMKDCLVLGNACGALCVGRIGANEKIPDMKEIKKFLKRNGKEINI